MGVFAISWSKDLLPGDWGIASGQHGQSLLKLCGSEKRSFEMKIHQSHKNSKHFEVGFQGLRAFRKEPLIAACPFCVKNFDVSPVKRIELTIHSFPSPTTAIEDV
jgi:hypothetical protein